MIDFAEMLEAHSAGACLLIDAPGHAARSRECGGKCRRSWSPQSQAAVTGRSFRIPNLLRAFVYWKLRQFVRHQTAAISHALRRHFPLAPQDSVQTQFSHNFRVEDAKIVSNIHRDSSLVASENLFALIIQIYVFEQSMIYLKITSFNIANY